MECGNLLRRSVCLLIFSGVVGLLSSLLLSPWALGAACCAAGSSSRNLMTEFNRWEFRLSHRFSTVVAEQFGQGPVLFWDDERQLQEHLLTPSVSFFIAPDWQGGVSWDLVSRQAAFVGGGSESSGLAPGDLNLFLAYEWLYPSPPQVWQPQVFLSYTQGLPTGRGLYQSQSPGVTDVTGGEQWTSRLGVHLFKSLYRFRYSLESHWGWSWPQSAGELQLLSRQELALTLGLLRLTAGERSWSYGVSWTALFKEGRGLGEGREPQRAPAELVYELSPYILWTPEGDWTVTMSYGDQSIFGPVRNSQLSRRVSLAISRALPI